MPKHASKATWLARVRDSSLRHCVPPFHVFTVGDWSNDCEYCLDLIQKKFRSHLVAVRSSRTGECAGVSAQAGRYRSFGAIDSNDRDALRDSVNSVITSYIDVEVDDEVLIQTWVSEAIAIIGATSASAGQYAGTASISYRVGNETHAITAGWTNTQRFWLATGTNTRTDWPSAVRRAFSLLSRLENVLATKALELEIAVDHVGRLRLLQVSPSTRLQNRVNDASICKVLTRVENDYGKRLQPRTGELGRNTLFGLMPDWNPAELIGEHPRALAVTLFHALITRGAWREARIELGYRHTKIHSLMAPIAGRPYIDVRASLNSLIPGTLSSDLALPVIDASIRKLREQPALHDRIETELQPTCIGFANEWRQQLLEAGLNRAEQRTWEVALKTLELKWTKQPTHKTSIRLLDAALEKIMQAITNERHDVHALVNCLKLIETELALPFAVHARLAFIARFQLTSLVRADALCESRLNDLFNSVSATRSPAGVSANASGTQRPSTFDIRVPPIRANVMHTRHVNSLFNLTERERCDIERLFKSHNHATDADAWIVLSQQRIELREHSKYVLSAALSHWFSALTQWGNFQEFDADALSHLSIKSLKTYRDTVQLRQHVAAGRKQHEQDHRIRMPVLITHRRDLRANVDCASRPTFFGRGRVSGQVQVIDRFTKRTTLGVGIVVLTRAADPGFDWIFDYPIAALVTCFGGPHSHMAIRCNELALPCVLGCGDTTYDTLMAAHCISIDLEQQHLMIDA